jgi:DNA-binding response OmpR family regulator
MKRILIVEDERSIAELERDYFEVNGFSVDIEESGDKGLEKAMSGKYDLVVLDVMLPRVDGFEICRQVRAAYDIPVIMVSAKKEDIDKIRGLGLGADDYITKPFSPGELVARVKAHISRYERLVGNKDQKKDEIKIGGIVIDRNSRRVFVNEREVVLTTKEFDLLALLASNPNKVFTKEELFDRIWGLESIGDITTVTVHIRKIREKIEADPSNPRYVETIWGVGYRFEL